MAPPGRPGAGRRKRSWCANGHREGASPGAHRDVPCRGCAPCWWWPRSRPGRSAAHAQVWAAGRSMRHAPRRCPAGPARPRGGAFFQRQAQPAQRLPHHRMADRDPMLLRHPAAQLGNRRIRLHGNTRTQHIVERLQPRPDVIVLRAGRRLAGLAQSRADLRDIGWADRESRCHRADRLACRRQHPIPQISPIGLASTPAHQEWIKDHRRRPCQIPKYEPNPDLFGSSAYSERPSPLSVPATSAACGSHRKIIRSSPTRRNR